MNQTPNNPGGFPDPLEIFIREGFDKDFLEAERVNNPPPRFPPIVSAADLCRGITVEPIELVKGILHRGSKLIYGGPSKAYKSWCLQDLCISVASGLPWLGFPTEKGASLYINFELQDFAISKRIRAICSAKGLQEVPANLYVWNLRGHACPLDHLLPDLLARIADMPLALIVPDPIYKTLSGRDENSAGDVGRVCNEIEALTVKTGAAVAYGAHYAKGNAAAKEAIDRISGSGVFARDPDSIVTASYLQEKDTLAVEFTLRNFPPAASFGARWKFPLLVRDSGLDHTDLRTPLGRKRTTDDSAILAALKSGMSQSQWFAAYGGEETIPWSTFRGSVVHLVKSSRVRKMEAGGKITYAKDEVQF